MSLRVIFDASGSSSGILAVAGVSFRPSQLTKASKEWRKLMKGRVFHMTDLNARKGDFSGISDGEVEKIMHGVVAILLKYASHIVAVSCDRNSISEIFPKAQNADEADQSGLERGFRSPYGIMLHLGMYAMGRFATNAGHKTRKISYTLETGDSGQASFVSYVNGLKNNLGGELILDQYSLLSISTSTKDNIEDAFHAADLIAWEWGRHVDRQQRGQPMRKSLLAVANRGQSDPDYFGFTLTDQRNRFFRHFDQRHIDRYVRVLRELAGAKTQAEIDDALKHWADTRFA